MKLPNPARRFNHSTLLRVALVATEIEHARGTIGKFEDEPRLAGAWCGGRAQEARTAAPQGAQKMPIHFGIVTDIAAVAEGRVVAARLVLDTHPRLATVRQAAGHDLVRKSVHEPGKLAAENRYRM